MLLSADLFQQIIDHLRSDDGGSREDRKVPRVGLRAATTIVPLSPRRDRRPVRATVRDLSAAGIGLVCPQRLEVDERFAVRLPRRHEDAALWVTCTVVQAVPAGERHWSIGAAFNRQIELPRQTPDTAADTDQVHLAELAHRLSQLD